VETLKKLMKSSSREARSAVAVIAALNQNSKLRWEAVKEINISWKKFETGEGYSCEILPDITIKFKDTGDR
jgi:hypothetical protein